MYCACVPWGRYEYSSNHKSSHGVGGEGRQLVGILPPPPHGALPQSESRTDPKYTFTCTELFTVVDDRETLDLPTPTAIARSLTVIEACSLRTIILERFLGVTFIFEQAKAVRVTRNVNLKPPAAALKCPQLCY
ncbi:hypothetical protein TNCV_3333901 [Trichonephila clavipes]|nr:hypothetical protein TNCV_3333901 [Trichonephila clavipes]